MKFSNFMTDVKPTGKANCEIMGFNSVKAFVYAYKKPTLNKHEIYLVIPTEKLISYIS